MDGNFQELSIARVFPTMKPIFRSLQLGICAVSGTVANFTGLSANAIAQIVPDNTLGSEGSIVTPNVSIEGGVTDRIDGGAPRGNNLFHSFQEFNVGHGRQVHFANPTGIENILSRVTGSNHSDIQGTLGVLGNANLYLINPNGIVFGPNARLDVRGSFFATTSDRLAFDNGYEFSASDPEAPPLLTLNTPLGLGDWLPPNRGEIASTGSLSTGIDLTLIAANLDLEGQLQAGNNLILQAIDRLNARDRTTAPFIATAGNRLVLQGDRTLNISALSHPNSALISGGDTLLRSANSIEGDAHFLTGKNFRLEQLDGSVGNFISDEDPIVLAVGNVSIGDYSGASLHVLAGGSVELGNVTIDSTGATDTTIDPANDNTIPGTTTPYSALSDVTLSDGTTVLNVRGSTQATLDVRAGIDWTQTPFTGVPEIDTPTDFPSGSVTFESPTASGSSITTGDISITQPNGLVLLTNQYRPNTTLSGEVFASSINTANGLGGGSVVIDASGGITTSFVDVSGGDLNTFDFGANGGDITFLAGGDLLLPFPSAVFSYGLVGGTLRFESRSSVVQEAAPAGTPSAESSIVDSLTAGSGTGGDVTVKAPQVSVGGNILSSLAGEGQSGNLSVTADEVSMDGATFSTATLPPGLGDAGTVSIEADTISLNTSFVGSVTFSEFGGNAGDVKVNARSFVATNGGQVISLSGGVGNTGNVTATVSQSIDLTGVSPIGSFSGLGTDVFPGAVGNGGSVAIETTSLTLRDGAQIRTSTLGTGNAGAIAVRADVIQLDGAVLNPVEPDTIPSGILSEVLEGADGRGNQIDITTRQLSVSNGAFISASTNATGNAGNIQIAASEFASFDGNPGDPFAPSGAFVGTLSEATGAGGTLEIDTPSLSVTGGAQLEALTESGANAGNIIVNARDSIVLSGSDTGLFSDTAANSTGNGGEISIETANLEISDQASIETSTEGTGSGGQLSVVADRILVRDEAQLSAGSPGIGDAGTISLQAERFTVEDGARVSVSSQNAGASGNLDINAPEIRLNSGTLSADTVEGDRANISLTTSDLQLRRRSFITTNATGDATGGNISIDTETLVALENSDITANAEQSFGGRITINAQAIFGTAFRDELTPESDITATSELGAEFSGIVTITTPEADATTGIVTLPENVSDPADRVVTGCEAIAGNSFTITGRGGLPEDPTTTLRGQTIVEDFRDIPGEIQTGEKQSEERPEETSAQPTSSSEGDRSPPSVLVESNGWVEHEDGTIELVAYHPRRSTLPMRSRTRQCGRL